MCLWRSTYFFHFMFCVKHLTSSVLFYMPSSVFLFGISSSFYKTIDLSAKKKKGGWEVIHPEIRIMVYMGKSCTPGTWSVNKYVVIPESLSC